MASSRKKVIVRRFSPGLLRGYLDGTGFVSQRGSEHLLQLLDLAGRTQEVPLDDVKMVSYVREFNLADEANPERLPRKTFLARPRTEGLWVRLSLRGDDQMEGLAPLDLALADNMMQERGLQIIPPDIRGNTQRVYIPRSAMTALNVIAVVTSPAKKKQMEKPADRESHTGQQPGLFSTESSYGSTV